jgi:hypothetical protein
MSAAVVNRYLRCGKRRICKSADSDAYRFIVAVFGVENIRPANRTEPENEPGALITDTGVFSGMTVDFERTGKARQRCEHAAGSSLAGEAVANANTPWVAFDFNAKLPAGTRG